MKKSHLIVSIVAFVTLAVASFAVVTCQREDAKTPDEEPTDKLVASDNWPFGGALPGTSGFPASVVSQLRERWQDRAKAYKPRTRHLQKDGSPKYTNRLFLQSSPYLLQHAHNPVNWFPWGDEAFELARKLGRPVLLSVGYSTCHWCHVMEEESFEDPEIAEYLNRYYIAIKVDREERPDVDAIYMQAVQTLTGSGGWPMTVWLTSDKKPFYGGTYFPPRDGVRGARAGFLTLLQKLNAEFAGSPDEVADSAQRLTQRLQSGLESTRPGDMPSPSTLHRAFQGYASNFDDTYGGTARARNKFPSSLPNRFLLRYHRRTGNKRALEMVALTLEKMAAGGMYDHVAGGFHRYSTDQHWLVPHFEKMLYDNALLTLAYLEGHQVTGKADFARVAREVLDYVARDMTAAEGGFYSATDADSLTPEGHREEGWFFTWTPRELRKALPAQLVKPVMRYYAVTDRGNFEGRNILHTPRPLPAVASDLGLEKRELRRMIDQARAKLYEARAKRPPPIRDEKILSAWNGLMISAFSQGALVLNDARYLKQAKRAASFVLKHLKQKGRLLRSFMDGRASHNGYLDDYAFLIAGLIDLYEASHELGWLQQAIELAAVLEKHYKDDDNGGYFMTSNDHEALLAREKPSYDGAEPSGNSIHAHNLLRLYELTTEERYREQAESTLKAFGSTLNRSPAALSEMLLAVDFYLDYPKEVVIIAPESPAQAEPLLEKLRARFLPNRVLSVVSEGKMQAAHQRVIPLLEQKVSRKGEPTAYVCERRVCQFPTSDPGVFAKQLRQVQRLEATQ
jgi:uncharacterized protein YyaL (SSP411 family)